MTVSSTPSEISYLGNGVTQSFPIPFAFETSADLLVRFTTAAGAVSAVTAGFSTAGGAGSTGTLTFNSAPPAGITVTILDNPAFSQSTDYNANDAFPAEAHERALDRGVRISKRLAQQIRRCLRFSDGDPIGDASLGSVDARKGKYLFFNAITGAIEYVVGVLGTVLSSSTVLAALLDAGYRYRIHPTETAAGLVSANLTFGFDPGDIRRYGPVVADGVTDCSAAVITALSVKGYVTFPPHGTVKCNSQLTIDLATTTLDGRNGALVSGVTAGAGLILESSGGAEQCARNAIRNLYIGGLNNPGVPGLYLAATGQLAGASVESVTIYGFETGVHNHENAFCINFHRLLIKGCTNGVYVDDTGTEASEALSFASSWIANCARAVWSKRTSCQLYFDAASRFDYNNQICEMEQGEAYFDNDYAESNTDASQWLLARNNENSFIRWMGGQIGITGPKTAFKLAWAQPGTGAVIEIKDTLLYSSSNSVGGDFLGDGAVHARGNKIQGFAQNSLAWAGGSEADNVCSNGVFATNLTGWTVAATGGSNVPIRNPGNGPSGTNCLEFSTNLAATTSTAYWEVAAEPFQIIGAAFATQSVNVNAAIQWQIQALGNDNVVLATSDVLNGIHNFNAAFPAAGTGYIDRRVCMVRCPPGTTKVRLLFTSDYSSAYVARVANVRFCRY